MVWGVYWNIKFVSQPWWCIFSRCLTHVLCRVTLHQPSIMPSSWVWVEPRSAWHKNQKHQFLCSGVGEKKGQNAKTLPPNTVIIVEYKQKHHGRCQRRCPEALCGEFGQIYGLLLDMDEGLKHNWDFKMAAPGRCAGGQSKRSALSQLPEHVFFSLSLLVCTFLWIYFCRGK